MAGEDYFGRGESVSDIDEDEHGDEHVDEHEDEHRYVVDDNAQSDNEHSMSMSMPQEGGSIFPAGDSDSSSLEEPRNNLLPNPSNQLVPLAPDSDDDDDLLGMSAGPLEHKPISDAYFREQEQSHIKGQSPKPSRIPIASDKERPLEMYEEEDSDNDSGEGDGLNDSNQSIIPIEGEYDPNEFMHLPVASDIKELFSYIGAYRVQTVDVEPLLKPFILDYIPAVGDIDAFIKIPRPDEVEDNLGLTVLDEPCAEQSDPTVLGLHLRALNKEAATSEVTAQEPVSKQLTRADQNPREIDQWIKNINELHRTKPATNVHYSKPMPDIDTLMQEWPPQVEEMLKRIELPTGDMKVKLEDYVDVICPLLDIPVHPGKRIQSLHVLFTLYSEFKNSQHFRALAEHNNMDNTTGGRDRSINNHDTLEL